MLLESSQTNRTPLIFDTPSRVHVFISKTKYRRLEAKYGSLFFVDLRNRHFKPKSRVMDKKYCQECGNQISVDDWNFDGRCSECRPDGPDDMVLSGKGFTITDISPLSDYDKEEE